MPRPRNTVRSVNVHTMLPEDLVARIYAHLHSEVEGRIPYQAQSKFYERAARDLLDKLDAEVAKRKELVR